MIKKRRSRYEIAQEKCSHAAKQLRLEGHKIDVGWSYEQSLLILRRLSDYHVAGLEAKLRVPTNCYTPEFQKALQEEHTSRLVDHYLTGGEVD